MGHPLVCMTLTGSSLEEDVKLTKKYEKYIDLVELRADFLTPEDQLNVRKFPSLISKPCILTIRREMGSDINAACGQLRKSYIDAETKRKVQ